MTFPGFQGLILKKFPGLLYFKSNQDLFQLILLQWKRLFNNKLLNCKFFNNICIKVKNNSSIIIILLLQIENLKNNDSLTIHF